MTIPPKYVIVSPVKDEENYIVETLRSVTSQSVKPVLWIIVDDGSRDRTAEVIKKFTDSETFIRVLRNPHSGRRQPGSAVIRAFNFGYEQVEISDFDFIVKLDCDLSFEPDYFEKLLSRFALDQSLGIASGVYMEQDKTGSWNIVPMPTYHAAGASKVIRKMCFQEIGGFVAAAGWDTVDEIRAMSKGWKTRHFPDLLMKHNKLEGSGVGTLKTSRMHGEIFYLTGGSRLFFALKMIHRAKSKPFLLGAAALLQGYLRAYFKRKSLLVTTKEAQYYRELLRKRLLHRAKDSQQQF